MRRIVLVIVLGMSLAGCAGLQNASNAISVATKSIDNPVTNTELYEIEASLRIVMAGLVTYRRACLQGTVDKNCRSNILAIQPYTRQVPALLTELRDFVRSDDRVNAIVIYKRLTNIYTSITTEAATRGVSLRS